MKFTPVILVVLLSIFLGCELLEEAEKAVIDISGRVTDEDQAVSGALVLLLEGTQVTDGLSLANGSITDSNGDYIILNVKAGEYYILAVDDRNGNMEFDAATDRLGFYGVDQNAQDIIPQKVVVSDQDIEDIDIVDLYSL